MNINARSTSVAEASGLDRYVSWLMGAAFLVWMVVAAEMVGWFA